MNREEIRNILLELRGEGLIPGRGVGADDILLAKVEAFTAPERLAFWTNFGDVLQEAWQSGEAGAFSNAAAFISRIPKPERPAGDEAKQIAAFLLIDPKLKKAAMGAADESRLIVAALRVLSALGLGDRVWWVARFNSWLHEARTHQNSDALFAWQAVLNSSRGLLNTGEIVPNFDAWFLNAQEVKEFPSLEVFTLLADQIDSPGADKEAIKEDVLEAYQNLYARCYPASDCPQGIQHLKSVIEAWLEDRIGIKPEEATCQLEWKQPDLLTPSARLNQPIEEARVCSTT